MHSLALILSVLVVTAGPNEYARNLGAKRLDQATLDAEGYGEKKRFKIEADGLAITLSPGEEETGWKTPPQLRVGGNFTISATLLVRKLPKPAQEDGSAFGLALATQDITQPDVTLVRMRETSGADVYRSIIKESNNPQQMGMPGVVMNRRAMMMMAQQAGAKPPKPPRLTFPATGDLVRMELEREGATIRFQVIDLKTGRSRYLGQATIPPMDITAVKLFATNRNGGEPIDVVVRDLTIRADRLSGLGTIVRSVFDQVVYGEPSSIENGVLIVGGPAAPGANAAQPGVATPAAARRAALAAASPTAAVAAQPAVAPPAAAQAPVPPAALEAVLAFAPATNIDAASAFAPLPSSAAATANPAAPQPPASVPPKARIPIEELDSIRFERTPALAARFVGQPNLDFTMPGLSAKKDDPKAKPEAPKADVKPKADDKPKADTKPKADDKPKADAKPKADEKKTDGTDDVLAPPPGTTEAAKFPKVEPKKNGIRDLHIALFGLNPAKIKQVTVNCPTDGSPTTWQLDTTGTQAWPLVIRRSGTEIAADLFLEPPPGDVHQKNFSVMVMYENGQAGNAQAMATEHSKPDLAIDPKAPAIPPLGAWVYLTNDEKLFGTFEKLDGEGLEIITSWQDHVKVPLARLAGVRFGVPEPKETAESFTRRLESRGSEDLLLARAKNGEVVAISGIVDGTEDGKLRFTYQGKNRTLRLEQVEGLVMAARSDSNRVADLTPSFSLPGGAVVSGKWKSLDAATWKVDTPWGQELKLPAADIQGVKFRDGRMTYLSELVPSKVVETAFFGHRIPYRRNVNLLGEPLKMDGKNYDRGIAVHSRCVLTYDLNGQYSTFEALVGFDDSVKYQGRADCRVFADDKELYKNLDLRASDPPAPISVSVAAAQQLRLVVDFGRGQDTGDRVIWANPRLFRQPPAHAVMSPAGKEPVASTAKK